MDIDKDVAIPYGRQSISESDIEQIVQVLRSDFLTQGPVVPRFEEGVARYCGARYAVATNSATSALHVACLALRVGPGDRVWTSPTTFVASANCALYCGAQVDFVDIDSQTYNMSVPRLAEKLARARIDGTLPKVVIPVHFCGQSCDMEAIHALAQEYGFRIIEDASHAIGAKYKGQSVGSCLFSDIAIFSFHPVKIITTGEGGMALTNDPCLAGSMQRYRSHGITSDSSEMKPRPEDEIWNYQQILLGYNYRMTDILAALGLSQLSRLDEFLRLRHEVADYYDRVLTDLPVTIPRQHPDAYSSYHLYPIRVAAKRCGKTQQHMYRGLRAAGILVNLHYIPVYRQPFYEQMGFRIGYCPEAERYYKETISLPMFPTLSRQQQQRVVSVLTELLSS
jgi:UDP-4-amino-4,6-dideoxy-N-acetyl-beta-L-altrosamine transaminase